MKTQWGGTTCRRKGSIVKQLYKLQSELAVVHEQRLASARAMDEARDLVEALKADKARLQVEVDRLRGLLYAKVLREHRAEDVTAPIKRIAKVEMLTNEGK